MSHFPPKPLLALTIGVVGHRLNRPPQEAGAPAPPFDVDKVRAAINSVLYRVRKTAADVRCVHGEFYEGEASITLVTALAEGADRIAAQAAYDAQMPFDLVQPCARDMYRATFDGEESREEFDRLAKKARATLILPLVKAPDRDEAFARSYAQAGATVLAQADLLLAVWDGQPARGRGGTAETVDEAARQATPIVVVDPLGTIQLRWSGDLELPLPAQSASELPIDSDFDAGLDKMVRALLQPPQGETEAIGLKRFLAASTHPCWKHFGWKIFAFVLGLRLLRHGPRPETPWLGWTVKRGLVAGGDNFARRKLREALNAADAIAIYNAHAFRTAFVANFLFGALAVLCVAISLLLQKEQRLYCTAGELLFVTLVVSGVFLARRRDWRRRWFEARETAERLRLSFCFWMLGIWPNALSANQPAWTGWYVRSLLRAQPPFSGDLSKLAGAPRKICFMRSRSKSGITPRPSARPSGPIACSKSSASPQSSPLSWRRSSRWGDSRAFGPLRSRLSPPLRS